MKKIIEIILLIIVIILVAGILFFAKKDSKKDNDKLNIVVTTFSSYDFTKQIVGEEANVTYLLGPGVDAHSYEPSANDLIKIKDADIFIYVGGEMEKWMDKILETDVISSDTLLIKISDVVDLIEEEEVDGAEEDEHEHEHEEEGAFDEHVWTSPKNAIKIVKYLGEEISKKDEKNKDLYLKNSEKYIEEIEEVQLKIKEIVDNKKRDRLVFGDKMPMQYFLNEYNLKASAAFNGCSTETEPSTKTITYLIEKVKEEKIPVILYIELSTGKTAKTIAEETGAEALQIQTLHNISRDDFENGETYVSLMTRNLEVLRKALN